MLHITMKTIYEIFPDIFNEVERLRKDGYKIIDIKFDFSLETLRYKAMFCLNKDDDQITIKQYKCMHNDEPIQIYKQSKSKKRQGI